MGSSCKFLQEDSRHNECVRAVFDIQPNSLTGSGTASLTNRIWRTYPTHQSLCEHTNILFSIYAYGAAAAAMLDDSTLSAGRIKCAHPAVFVRAPR